MNRVNSSLLLAAILLSGISALESATPSASNSLSTDEPILTPTDLLRIETFGATKIAPDCHSIAYVRVRPVASLRNSPGKLARWLGGVSRGDIWVTDIDGTPPTNITRGEANDRGFCIPTWSPDGSQLAMLSVQDGLVGVCMWTKATGKLTTLVERNVSEDNVWWWPQSVLTWVDNQHIAVVLLPVGRPAQIQSNAAIVASRKWSEMWAGKVPTSTTRDSGLPDNLDEAPQVELVLIDVGTGALRTVMAGLGIRDLSLSPNHRYFAFLKQVARRQAQVSLDRNVLKPYEAEDRFELGLATIAGHLIPADCPPGTFVSPDSLSWSPDGESLAFIGAMREGDDLARVFRGRVGEPITVVPIDKDITPTRLVWSTKDQLLVGGSRVVLIASKHNKRFDWWETTRDNHNLLHLITERFEQSPERLQATTGGSGLLGIIEGDVWRLEVPSCSWTNLTATFEPTVNSLIWSTPSITTPDLRDTNPAVVLVTNAPTSRYYRLDISSGHVGQMMQPSDNANLSAYCASKDAAVFSATEPNGRFLTLVHGNNQCLVAAANEFLGTLAQPQYKMLTYRSLDGESLNGWLMMPAHYAPGTRCPMVVWLYPGSVIKPTSTGTAPSRTPSGTAFREVDDSPFNLQLLAARGYAVLCPSMPLPYDRLAFDPYMELTKGVLPAVDKAIEMGIADPQRLAIMGQSFGGFGVYGLVTQTRQFKAAITLAGISDFSSVYGAFGAWEQYSESIAPMTLLLPEFCERGQFHLGNPPWKDAGRYLRNSPIFYVDRVETPLLILQGDMDGVPISQGEQFFTALSRQGKRARFVRYWGEGHVYASPANVCDMWKNIYGWLDEFLPQVATHANSSSRNQQP